MNTPILHTADSRGLADHGWLLSRHTFSFSSYHDPERMHFGALRVLNDDWVAPGMGFSTHPHSNMEIISIVLEGELEHKDSMGTVARIKAGDVQVMSAGSGVSHSEYNASGTDPVRFLQIWVFPNQKNVKPRYDQITLKDSDLHNQLHQIVSPNPSDDGVWIQQSAWFHLGNFAKGISTDYHLKLKGDGVYFFVLEGEFLINGIQLNRRDGLGIVELETIHIESLSDHSQLLAMEIPMG